MKNTATPQTSKGRETAGQRFKVRKKDSRIEYVAWSDNPPTYYSFTVNDGCVPGGVASLPSEEFWRLFDRA